jgi:DNA replication protein
LGELKVTLYAFWFLDRQEGSVRYISFQDFSADSRLMEGLSSSLPLAPTALKDALERAVIRGTLLKAQGENDDIENALYFLNSVRGRAAILALQQGTWSPSSQGRAPVTLTAERPNLYRIYEENIGPLTPMISETLQQAEQDFPIDWIEEAIRTAVEKNVRNWRYVEAILRSRKEKGHYGSDKQGSKEDRRRYYEGEYADFIEH